MPEPVSSAMIAAKVVAERAVLASKEALKTSEVIKIQMDHYKTSECSKLKELYRNPTEKFKTNYKHLFGVVDKARLNPELRASMMNRLMTDPNLIGQMGEYHAERTLNQYGTFERQVSIHTDRGNFKVDFVGKLTKDMPIKVYTIKDGIPMSTSDVIRAGERIGVEVKNGLYEIRQKFDHVINQALAARELTGKGYIGISQSMMETISQNPDTYADLFRAADAKGIKIFVTQPTMSQQLGNITSLL